MAGRAIAAAGKSTGRKADTGKAGGGGASSVYVVFEVIDGVSTRVVGVKDTLGAARKVGKGVADGFNPAVHQGTPIDSRMWVKGEDGRSWVLAFTSGSSAVVEKHRVTS